MPQIRKPSNSAQAWWNISTDAISVSDPVYGIDPIQTLDALDYAVQLLNIADQDSKVVDCSAVRTRNTVHRGDVHPGVVEGLA